MGAMKRLNQWHRVEGRHIAQGLRVLAGLEEPPETKEERALRKEAEAESRTERAAIQAVEAEAAAAHAARRLAERRAEVGPPVAPQASTGFYACELLPGAFFPVGTGPWPDYRPPGLAWDRAWKQPKPADVPWADEVPPPRSWAPDPKPIREAVGKLQQGRMF